MTEFQELTFSTDVVYWFFVLIFCTDFLYWILELSFRMQFRTLKDKRQNLGSREEHW